MLPFDGMPKRFSRFYAIFTKDEAFERGMRRRVTCD